MMARFIEWEDSIIDVDSVACVYRDTQRNVDGSDNYFVVVERKAGLKPLYQPFLNSHQASHTAFDRLKALLMGGE